ncbi:Purine ribonucleoside efflux pump nepI [Ewingella americana]|uniref:Purine ribonucleoside efflux pump nepI n=1 Tax=Ewingella americana TaxID=41202 RepID=A0A377TFD4_9GAMM|nr:Purine ribonucleoside efflux pump nepI [Ewingella americana]
MTECTSLDAQPNASAFKRWLSVISLAFGTFVLINTEFLPIGLLTPIAHSLNVSEGRAGLAVMLPGWQPLPLRSCCCCFPPAESPHSAAVLIRDGDSFQRGGDARALFWGLLIGRIILGVAVGGFWSFAIPAGRRLVADEQGARATSLISAGVAVGTVAGVPAGAFIGELFGWRMAFTLNTALAVGVFLLQWATLPSLPAKQSIKVSTMFSVAKIAGVRYGLIIALFMAAAQFSAYTYLEPWLRFQVGLSASNLSLLLMAYGIAGLVGTFLTEVMVKGVGVKHTLLACLLIMGVAVVGASQLSNSALTASTLIVLWGLAFGALPICLNIWVYQAAPEQFETGSSLIVFIFQISLASGAFFGGVLADSIGTSSAFMLGGILALLASVIVLFTRPRPAVR